MALKLKMASFKPAAVGAGSATPNVRNKIMENPFS